MASCRFWTLEDQELLRELYTDLDKDMGEIEGRLKRTSNAIRLKASRMGIERPIPEIPLWLKLKTAGVQDWRAFINK